MQITFLRVVKPFYFIATMPKKQIITKLKDKFAKICHGGIHAREFNLYNSNIYRLYLKVSN